MGRGELVGQNLRTVPMSLNEGYDFADIYHPGRRQHPKNSILVLQVEVRKVVWVAGPDRTYNFS